MSLIIAILAAGTPAWANRSRMLLPTPHVIGLIKPSGGGGVNAELIRSTCDTNVGSPGIQLPINDPAAWLRHPHHLFGDIERLGRKHRPEHRKHQVEGIIRDPFKMASVSFVKAQTRQAPFRGPPVPCLHKIFRNVDSSDVGACAGHWKRCRAVSAA